MKTVRERSQIRVRSVGGKEILGEVIRTETEEVDFLGQRIRGHGGGWDLHHDADFHSRRRVQLESRLFEQPFYLMDFIDRGYHREHQTKWVPRSDSKRGAQLVHQRLRSPKQLQPQPADAMRRIRLCRLRVRRERLGG